MRKARSIVLAVACTATIGVFAAPAGAATPAVQGCYGDSVSALAAHSAGGFGAGVVGFAQDPTSQPGLGDGVQALQAGLVPNDIVPNTCNGS